MVCGNETCKLNRFNKVLVGQHNGLIKVAQGHFMDLVPSDECISNA